MSNVDTSIMDEHAFRQLAIRRARAYSASVASRRAEAQHQRDLTEIRIWEVVMLVVFFGCLILQVAVLGAGA